MSKNMKVIIRYDGSALSDHEMDISDLAPSLLALGELCNEANRILNGNAASIRVMVRADAEQHCFQLGFELVQNLIGMLASLSGQNFHDAKSILQWIGIIGSPDGGLFGVYKFLAKNKEDDEKSIINITNNITNIQENGGFIIHGDNNSEMVVNRSVHQLAKSESILKNTKKILAPVLNEGYEFLEFESEGSRFGYFDKNQAEEIINLQMSQSDLTETSKSRIRATVRIKRAVYQGSGSWTIIHGKVIEAKILDEEWLSNFQKGNISAPPRSTLDVDLMETMPINEGGIAIGASKYEITKVHSVGLPKSQRELDV